MPRQSVISRKRRGPLPTGKGVPILVRIQPQLLAGLDAWISQQNGSFTRPEAIRRLIEFALKAKQKNQGTGAK
jgi:metal-responsive CopG/Arc/MetJ family transcriptional regulator